MNAYLWILVWTFILFIVCEVLQYQEWKELEKKYLEEKRKNAKAHDTIEELLRKLADRKRGRRMTREEAIDLFKDVEVLVFRDVKQKYFHEDIEEAFKIAIEALENG